jgi:hypothetical protein
MDPDANSAQSRICTWDLHKYANLPMSLADACLVRMTETLQIRWFRASGGEGENVRVRGVR